MDISTLYMLLALASLLFLVSLFCAVTEHENVITIMCMFFSGIIFWATSNEYIGGTLTRINSVTGTVDVIRDSTASSVLLVLGLLMLAGFAVQVWKAVSTSGMVQELGD